MVASSPLAVSAVALSLLSLTTKTRLLSIKTQQRADMTRSRRDSKFSSHASGNMKPG